jgi:hypothetical protein
MSTRPQTPLACRVQLRERVTWKKRASVIARIIRGYLYAVRGGVGVVGPPVHHARLKVYMAAEELARLRVVGWYQDVSVLNDSELVVLLGEPPVPPRAIRQRLIQEGCHEDAVKDGDWGDLFWTNDLGDTVERKGYRDPAWREAHQAIQGGRLRQVLADIPGTKVVHSAEELGLPVIHPCVPLTVGQVKVLRGLDEATRGVVHKAFGIQDFGTKSGESVATARRHLKLLAATDLVTRVGERGGWRRNF